MQHHISLSLICTFGLRHWKWDKTTTPLDIISGPWMNGVWKTREMYHGLKSFTNTKRMRKLCILSAMFGLHGSMNHIGSVLPGAIQQMVTWVYVLLDCLSVLTIPWQLLSGHTILIGRRTMLCELWVLSLGLITSLQGSVSCNADIEAEKVLLNTLTV